MLPWDPLGGPTGRIALCRTATLPGKAGWRGPIRPTLDASPGSIAAKACQFPIMPPRLGKSFLRFNGRAMSFAAFASRLAAAAREVTLLAAERAVEDKGRDGVFDPVTDADRDAERA